MGPTGCRARVLQIHPTRKCNLKCLHCYSLSGPTHRDELSPALLSSAISDAAQLGYNIVSVSGGEPLLYGGLRRILERAQACGMATTVTSNGMLLDRRRLRMLQDVTNLLAISLDGVPESHNRMRASPRAFGTMRDHLEAVRESGIPFGFIFTLTQYNLDELEWAAEFAVAEGAALLQIHPLEIVGRAGEQLTDERPDERELTFGVLETARLRRRMADRLRIQLDVTDRQLVRAEPARVLADDVPVSRDDRAFAEVVSPLIIEADGVVVPLQHGFARAYALGNLESCGLKALAERWHIERAQSFRAICRGVLAQLGEVTELPFINWYEVVERAADRSSPFGGNPSVPMPGR